MKKEYALLEVNVIRFENEDIVTSSVASITSYTVGDDNMIAFNELFNK